MIKKLIPVLLIASSFFACNSKISDQTSPEFYMPAEWEPHEAVWFGWEKESAYGFYPAIAEIITTLKPHVTVKIAFDNYSLKDSGMATLKGLGVDTTGIKTYIIPGERYWIRDHGAAFLVNKYGDLGVADFGWDLYGFPAFLELKYEGNKDSVDAALSRGLKSRLKTGSVDSLMAAAEDAVILKTDVVHEGGATEVNGRGTFILCEATVFQKNPDMDREHIEAEFMRVLGVSHIIRMKQGLADDPHWFLRRIVGDYIGGGTGGHTDEFVRFADPNTILPAWVDEAEKNQNPINRMNYERMNENYQILNNATDQDGQAFKIIKVPLPDLIPVEVVVRPDVNRKGQEDFALDLDRHPVSTRCEGCQGRIV